MDGVVRLSRAAADKAKSLAGIQAKWKIPAGRPLHFYDPVPDKTGSLIKQLRSVVKFTVPPRISAIGGPTLLAKNEPTPQRGGLSASSRQVAAYQAQALLRSR